VLSTDVAISVLVMHNTTVQNCAGQ